ncbi:Arc family DNA-binding protein [Aeromonas jandaei]|uniref:Arc family DNA-binding protein n=1 Tax=Aeromonas jandaei TaxID=650 RepID=UPI001626784F|nr:Arc family DNA-binding protein [Aeromonas jandaei]
MSQPKPYPLRMSDEMRASLQESADRLGRSLNAEIVYRLQRTFDEDAAPTDSTPRKYQRKQKYTLQSDMPDEAMQELMTRIQEVWDKYKASQEK